MTLSLYHVSAPELARMLGNLKAILQKAEAHAEAKKIEPDALLLARLYPDMLPLLRQVQVACDNAKGGAARLAGVAVPAHEDNEKTFADLGARIDKTVAFINTLQPAQFEGAEDRKIELTFPGITLNFTGLTYLNNFVLPNFHFHVTTAYAILRHNGLEIGKGDYLGNIR
ncbi:MAG: DUF1993 domain-containing protein [Spongiibacteraceae bacterium]